jgi:hypothetical protein
MSDKSPFFIQQTAIVAPNRSVSMSLLDNLVREKWKLKEIRIVCTPIDASGLPAIPFTPDGLDFVPLNTARVFGVASMLDFGIRLQSTYLTVPRVVPAELLRSPFFDSLAAPEDAADITSASTFLLPQRAIIWTLPEPLFVPPGAKMYAELLFNAAEGANSFLWSPVAGQPTSAVGLQVQVTLIGNRTTESAPVKSRIPYATTYRTPKLAIGAAGNVQTFEAEDFQLQNHCDETIYVQRITAYNVAAQRMPTTVKYSTSQGKYINRELAPLFELHSNGALSLHTVLEKNEFIAVEGEIDSTPARLPIPPNGDPSDIDAFYEQQAMFGLVGYREVDTAALWGPPLVALTNGVPGDIRTAQGLREIVDLRLPEVRPYTPQLPFPLSGNRKP